MNTAKLATNLLLLAALHSHLATAFAQGTAFTYQGRLNQSGLPFSGTAEFQPTLWDSENGGAQRSTNNPASVVVTVSNGLFVLPLDFGNHFPGADRWLQLEVRTTLGSFTPLTPRQKLTAAPYALTASNLSGTLPATQLSGALSSAQLAGAYTGVLTFSNPGNSFGGDGSAVTSLNASQLASGTVPDARLAANVARTTQVWLSGGNAGTTPAANFVGTTDNQPLELRANNQRVLRLEPRQNGSANVIGGASMNYIHSSSFASVIAGGGFPNNSNTIDGSFNAIGGGGGNTVASGFSIIGGGAANKVHAGSSSFIGGGAGNQITNSAYASISGGELNFIGPRANHSQIGGGLENMIVDDAGESVIGGGTQNRIASINSVIGGGYRNEIQGGAENAVISGGYSNAVNGVARNSVVGGGIENQLFTSNSVIAAGARNTIMSTGTGVNGSCTISGGFGNTFYGNIFNNTIGGGVSNSVTNSGGAFIGGGFQNRISQQSDYSTIAGGLYHEIGTNSERSTIGGGYGNTILSNAPGATIPGGYHNVAGTYAFAAGNGAKATHYGSFVWAGGQSPGFSSQRDNQVRIRAEGGARFDVNNGHWVEVRYNDPLIGVETLITTSSGAYLSAGGTWVDSSDRTVKENFRAVEPKEILEKVAALPITKWNYKAESDDVRHIGPVAQDFHAAFGVGGDDKHIAALDGNGVALAAIQGLNQKLEETRAELKRREAENEELKILLKKLEQRLDRR